MGFLKRKKDTGQHMMAYFLSGSGAVPEGYTRLLDTPEIAACINRTADIISSATIYLMENTDQGDKRIHDGLSRFVDISPYPALGTRKTWMDWIVCTLLGEGDGNAFVLPHVEGGQYAMLEPMPGAVAIPTNDGRSYYVTWRGRNYDPTEVLHFRDHTDPNHPWKGRGCRVQAKRLAESLASAGALKASLTSPEYKPPLIVSVSTDSDLSDPEKREKWRKAYLDDTGDGKPWIIPEGLMKVDQVKPLSLTDLAIKDTAELDKKTAASIFGAPAFLLGVGSYNEHEFNNWIRTRVIPICVGIEQTLTLGLLENPKRYWKINRRRLYAYDLKTMVDIDCAMADRGYLCGDDVREDTDRDPIGLTEHKVLENYIPYDMSGKQQKLMPPKEDTE